MYHLPKLQNNMLQRVMFFFLLAISGFALAAGNQDSPSGSHSKKLPVVRFWLKGHLMNSPAAGKNAASKLPALTLVRNSKPKIVHTCKEFLGDIKGWQAQDGTKNMQAFNAYQPCVAVHIIHHGVPSIKTAFHKNFSEVILKSLDLTDFSSSLQSQVHGKKKTLFSLGLNAAVKSATTVIVKHNGRLYRFDLAAKGDFDRDGNEDLLVRFIDQAKEKNNYTLRFLVLTHKMHGNVWNAIDAVDFFRK